MDDQKRDSTALDVCYERLVNINNNLDNASNRLRGVKQRLLSEETATEKGDEPDPPIAPDLVQRLNYELTKGEGLINRITSTLDGLDTIV